MSKFKVSELAEKLGIERGTIYTYERRGKIILKDGWFDDNNSFNKEFLQNRKIKSGKVPEKEVEVIDKQPEIIEKRGRKKKEDTGNYTNYLSTAKLSALKAEKLYEEIELLRLKNRKQSNELIPLEYALRIFGIHSSNIMSVLYNFTDNYTSDLCERIGADRNVLAEFRGKLKNEINGVVLEAKTQTKKDLNNYTDEFIRDNAEYEQDV
ncbi:MAG: hypothetical protein PHW73_00905 [Atribacterota bacterium]|nr:hypothetical protein [Atribacterota bacterium]